MADKMSEPEVIKPIRVTVVGGTGVSGDPLTNGTVGVTPDSQPNLAIVIITPAIAILVRFINDYLVMLSGTLIAAITTDAIPAADLYQKIVVCMGISLAGPVIGLIKNVATIFGKLENKYPILTGSV